MLTVNRLKIDARNLTFEGKVPRKFLAAKEGRVGTRYRVGWEEAAAAFRGRVPRGTICDGTNRRGRNNIFNSDIWSHVF